MRRHLWYILYDLEIITKIAKKQLKIEAYPKYTILKFLTNSTLKAIEYIGEYITLVVQINVFHVVLWVPRVLSY